MATVHVTLCSVANRAQGGPTMPVPKSIVHAAATMESDGQSRQADIVAQPMGRNNASSRFWCVCATGNIFVAFGADPEAGAGRGWFVPAGAPMFFSVSDDNEKIAVMDAA